VVQDKAPENVKRLPNVREASRVVREEAESVVIELHSDFAEKHKRPSDLQVTMDFPFSPYALESFPCFLSHGAVKQAVLRGLFSTRATNLAVGGDAHELQPRPNREALVEGEPDEGAHFP
jgi:hypothetical protein